MAFDVQGARAAGYSDAEIANHLAGQSNFDTQGARSAGYSDAEIIGHLTPVDTTYLRDARQTADNSAMTHQPFDMGGAVRAADRLPGNIAKSVEAQVASWGNSMREYWNEGSARYQQAQAQAPSILKSVAPSIGYRTAAAQQQGAATDYEQAAAAAERAAQARARGQAAIPADAGIAERAVQQGVASAITSFPVIATAGPIAGPLILGTGAGAERFSQMRAAGRPYDEATRSGATFLGLEAGTEYLPAKALMRAGTPFFSRFMQFALSEFPGENITTLGEMADDYFRGLRPDVTLADVAAAVRDTTLATAVGGATQVGAAHVLQTSVERANAAAEARRAAQALDPAMMRAVAERGMAASGAPLVPQSTTPDTRAPEIAPDQYFLSNRLVPGTEQTLTGGYTINQGPVEQPTASVSAEEASPGNEPAAPTAALERLKTDPDLRASFEQLKRETGWESVGGRALGYTQTDTSSYRNENVDVEGRTLWLPRYPWFKDKPDYANEAMIQKVITKTLIGKKLGSREQQLATWLADVADDRIKSAPYMPAPNELSGAGLESNLGDAHEAALVARASELDDAAVERLAVRYGDDDAGFFRAVRELVDRYESANANAATGPTDQPAPQVSRPAVINRDLFAGSDKESESLARRNAVEQERLRRDAGRTGDVSIETGDPTDLFSQARKQTDLTDKPSGMAVPSDGLGEREAAWAPGNQWTPGYQIVGQPHVGAPAVANAVTLGVRANDQRTLEVPTKPIRREHILEAFQRALKMKVYEGKPFQGRMLGFFRPKNFEVRVKRVNDLEVTSHEIFHWLDRTYPTLRALYHQPQFRDQLKGVSYDKKSVSEGFAEFGRLYMTQEQQAASRTPDFYDAFVAEIRRLGLYPEMRLVQDKMHQWFAQGAELRAASKIGTEKPPIRDRVDKWRKELADVSQSRIIDYLNRAKTIERETGSATMYRELRLLDHSRSVSHAFLNYGTAEWTPEGDLRFNGKGLRQIFEPVADVWDDALAYFVGRRASELRRYGKERLFAADEIQALINRGTNSPKAAQIQQAFTEYQEFNDRLLDFAVQSGIVSKDTRELWRKMYNAYVPFYRVRDTLATGVPGQRGGLFKRLTGGTENLSDTWDNIVRNAEMTVEASLRNVAKRKLYQSIARSPLGQKYAVAIPAGQKPVNIGMEQIESALGKLVEEAATKANDPTAKPGDQAHWAQVAMALDLLSGKSNMAGTGGELQTIADQATFFLRGQKPTITDKDFYLAGGKPVWFQIGDQELMRMLEAINSYRPLHIVEKAFGAAARVLRRGVTLAPEFQLRNFLRDQMNAATLSQGGQKPFIDGLAAVKDVLSNDEALRLFFLNGGGFGLQQAESGQALKLELERVRKANGSVNVRAILDTPAKVFEWYDKATQASELATRVAEFKKIREGGGSLREAAYQANEVSTDFAAHGSDPALAFVRLSVPFFGARLQGLARLGREMNEHPVRLASRALLMITLPSLLLYWRNKDDERYTALTPETKALYWVLLDPRGDGVWLIPKPFEVGALFGTVPEVAWDQFENGNDKRTVAAMRFMLEQTLSFNPIPQALKPPLDLARNRDFRGSPIVPEGLKDVDPSEQFTAYTAPSMKRVGDLFGVSPVKLEYLLRSYLGTLGTYAVSAADAMVKPDASTGAEPTKPPSQQPIARAFRRSEPYRSTSYEQDFYDMVERSRRVVATANHMRKTLRISDQANYITENAEAYGRNEALNRIRAKVNSINESLKIIRFSPDLSADEKRRKIDALQRQKNELLRAATTGLSEQGTQ